MNAITKALTSPSAWVVPALSLIGFVVVWLSGQNQDIFIWINKLGRSHSAEIFWANTTIIGDTLVAVALLGLFVRRRPDLIWALLITALFATLWVHGLKPLLENPRPGAVLTHEFVNIVGVTLHGSSFPSGHTATAFALAGAICILRIHPILSISALALAILAGVSRIAVGVHWPLDIFAGAFGGWLAAVAGVFLYKRLAYINEWGDEIPGQKFFNIGLLMVSLSLFIYDNGYPGTQLFQYTIAVISIIAIAYNFKHSYSTKKVAGQ